MLSSGSQKKDVTLKQALKRLGQLQGKESKYDFLRVSGDAALVETLNKKTKKRKGTNQVLFSDDVIKINKRDKHQHRHLVITNHAIYNFKPGKYKQAQRAIEIRKIDGIVVARNSNEVVLKVHDDYDYRFQMVRRTEAIEVCDNQFQQLTSRHVALTFSEKESLGGECRPSWRFFKKKNWLSKSNNATLELKQRHPNSESKEDHSGDVMEGWLSKLGETNKQWRRRFFILAPQNLLYYNPRAKTSIEIFDGHIRCDGYHDLDIKEDDSRAGVFDSVIGDDYWRQQFVTYCESKYCAEPLMCYLDICEFEHDSPAEQTHQARKIFDNYVRLNAQHQVSCTFIMRNEIDNTLSEQRVSSSMFDDLKQLVKETVLTDWFPRWLTHLKQQSSEVTPPMPGERLECWSCAQKISHKQTDNRCRSCKKLFCGDCIAAQYGKTPRTCDFCEDKSKGHEYSFSYYQSNKKKLLSLSTDSGDKMREWVQALMNVKKGKVTDSEKDSGHVEGWLLKKTGENKWQQLYAMLDKNRLWFYEMAYKGRIMLSAGCTCHSSMERSTKQKATLSLNDSQFGGYISKSQFAWRFVVGNSQRFFKLAADTNEELNNWIEEINLKISTNFPSDVNIAMMEDYVDKERAQDAPIGDVVFVFTDIQNSTNLWESAPDAMSDGLELHDRILRSELVKCKGYEVKTEGDAFMVTFKSVIAALIWCLRVQHELLDAEWPLELLDINGALQEWYLNEEPDEKELIFSGIRVRMGIHVGQPNCRPNPVTDRMDYYGPVVNRSARISDSAHGGQVICTQEAMKVIQKSRSMEISKDMEPEEKVHLEIIKDLVIEDLKSHPYKGIGEKVQIYQCSSSRLRERKFPALRIHHKIPEAEVLEEAEGAEGAKGADGTEVANGLQEEAEVGEINRGSPGADEGLETPPIYHYHLTWPMRRGRPVMIEGDDEEEDDFYGGDYFDQADDADDDEESLADDDEESDSDDDSVYTLPETE